MEDPEIKKLREMMDRVSEKMRKKYPSPIQTDIKSKAANDDLSKYHDEDDVGVTDDELVAAIERDRETYD